MAIKHLPASPAIDRFLSLYPLPFYYRCHLVWLSHLEEKLKSDISDAPPPGLGERNSFFVKWKKIAQFSLSSAFLSLVLAFFFKTKRIENPFRFFYPFAHNLPTANRSMNLFSPICRRGLGCYFRPISHLPPVQPATTPAFTRKHFFFKLKNKIPGLGFRQDRVICGHFVEKMF